MSLTLTITGTEQLQAALAQIGGRTTQEVAAALYAEAEEIMGDSKEFYVPVEHGALRNSGFVKMPEFNDKDVSVKLGFGGVAKAYAIAVHEHLSESSPRSWQKAEAAGRPVRFSPGGPKYLERPMLERAKTLASRIAGRLKKGLGT
jgi:hypothetical protein